MEKMEELTEQEEMLADHISGKGLASRMDKELYRGRKTQHLDRKFSGADPWMDDKHRNRQ